MGRDRERRTCNPTSSSLDGATTIQCPPRKYYPPDFFEKTFQLSCLRRHACTHHAPCVGLIHGADFAIAYTGTCSCHRTSPNSGLHNINILFFYGNAKCKRWQKCNCSTRGSLDPALPTCPVCKTGGQLRQQPSSPTTYSWLDARRSAAAAAQGGGGDGARLSNQIIGLSTGGAVLGHALMPAQH